MKRFTKLATAVLVVAAAFVGTGGLAAADFDLASMEREYQDAMWYLVPTLEQWTVDVQNTVNTAELKPEQACRVDLPELASRGENMSADLAGTWSPEAVDLQHQVLTDSVDRLARIAETACADPASASSAIQAEVKTFETARRAILRYLVQSIGEPVDPVSVQPVTLQ